MTHKKYGCTQIIASKFNFIRDNDMRNSVDFHSPIFLVPFFGTIIGVLQYRGMYMIVTSLMLKSRERFN